MTADPDPGPDGDMPRAGLSGGLLSAIFVVVVLVGVAAAWLIPDGSTATAAEGEPAPALALATFGGETFDMVEHFQADGGPVVLNLWASWCEPCLREFPVLSRFALENPEVTVVGVAVQDQEADARAFVEEMQPEFITGWDRDGSIRDAYPSFGLPATFVIDHRGVITDVVVAELTPERMEQLDVG